MAFNSIIAMRDFAIMRVVYLGLLQNKELPELACKKKAFNNSSKRGDPLLGAVRARR